MSRTLSIRARCSALACALHLVSCVSAATAETPASPAPPQICWQRTLDDALALAKAQDRPILVAINMDAESGCERIVHEEYADLKFVAATREFVCVMAHPLRHTARDHDDSGRRIVCPRLGEVTCGEHVALEPILFEKWLSDGERVAPRHALILQDGSKAWDISLAFDITELDRAVLASAEQEHGRRARAGIADEPVDLMRADVVDLSKWSAADLAARKSQRERALLERRVTDAQDAELPALVAKIAEQGDRGALDALRVAALRIAGSPSAGSASPTSPSPAGNDLERALVAAARKLGLASELAQAVLDRLRSLGEFGGAYEPTTEARLLPLLAELDGTNPSTRTFLAMCAILDTYHPQADAALVAALVPEDRERVQPLLASNSLRVAAARALRGDDAGRALLYTPVPDPIDPELAELEASAPAEELEARLSVLEKKLAVDAPAPVDMARYGATALALGRARIDAKLQGAQFFLEDAEVWLARALEREPAHFAWWLVRARAAYLRGHFREQAEFGERAWALAKGRIDERIGDATREANRGVQAPDGTSTLKIQRELAWVIEASRWIGDAHARLLGERSGQDIVEELKGLSAGARALSTVITSPAANAQDWISLASFFGALGFWREELAFLQAGAERFPADVDLRQRLNASLWNGGRIDLAPLKAEWIASRAPDSADAAWFAGHAWVLAAEDLRRRMEPDAAIADYERAQKRFEEVIAKNPAYADNAQRFIAITWHGRGMAHLIADRRVDAATCLVGAVRASREIVGVRDGLDRDVLDLLDQCLEWRASGKSPVDARTLLDELEDARPGDPYWATAVSDALLREALRADGRNDEWAERTQAISNGLTKKERVRLPSAMGSNYLRDAIEAAQRLTKHGDTPELRRPLAQCETIRAERELLRAELVPATPDPEGYLERARRALTIAAPLLGLSAPAADADFTALTKLAAELRAQLGEARPVNRPGR